MDYIIHNVATILHQMNEDTNKVYQENRPTVTPINVWRQCLQVQQIIFPMFSPRGKYPIQI